MLRRILSSLALCVLCLCFVFPSTQPTSASCPVLLNTPTLPPIEGLRARRMGKGLNVRWDGPDSLGTSTHTVIKVMPVAPGPCHSVRIAHTENSRLVTLPDQPGRDLFIAASLMRGNLYVSKPAIIMLSKWRLRAGYPDEDKDDDVGKDYYRSVAPVSSISKDVFTTDNDNGLDPKPTPPSKPTPEPTLTPKPTPDPNEHSCPSR